MTAEKNFFNINASKYDRNVDTIEMTPYQYYITMYKYLNVEDMIKSVSEEMYYATKKYDDETKYEKIKSLSKQLETLHYLKYVRDEVISLFNQ